MLPELQLIVVNKSQSQRKTVQSYRAKKKSTITPAFVLVTHVNILCQSELDREYEQKRRTKQKTQTHNHDLWSCYLGWFYGIYRGSQALYGCLCHLVLVGVFFKIWKCNFLILTFLRRKLTSVKRGWGRFRDLLKTQLSFSSSDTWATAFTCLTLCPCSYLLLTWP